MQHAQTVFESAINGQYQAGLILFHAIEAPSPDEQRWAAVCHYNLKNYFEAKDLLELAQSRGCHGATIELATVLRLLGQPVKALEQFDRLDIECLSVHDRALERRERGLLEYIHGHYQTALNMLEQAWIIIRGTELAGPQSAVAQTLGFTLYAVGRNQEALHYLGRALQNTNLAREARIRDNRANCLIGLGRFSEAQLDLRRAHELCEHIPSLFGALQYTSGVLARAQNRLAEALTHFDASINFAGAQSELETECYAQLQASAVLMSMNQVEQARMRLLRAQRLVHSCGRKGKALLSLRQGSLKSMSVDSALMCDGLALLNQARAEFAIISYDRGVVTTDLCLAEAHVRLGDASAARANLERANEIRISMACAAALNELIYLPSTLKFLQTLPPDDLLYKMLEDWSNLPELPPYRVELLTLGASELRVNGKKIGLDIAGTVELLAYLFRHPNRTRDEILTALFAKKGEERAANYFHQARLTLQQATSVIKVLYNKCNKTYCVKCEVPVLIWDVIELEHLLVETDEDKIFKALDIALGAFLPSSDSDWAVAEREKVSWSVIKVGLEALDLWSKRGEYAKCLELAVRLREFEPLHPALAEYLVIATNSLEGEVEARRKLREIEGEFKREVGEIPEELLALHSRLGMIN